MPISYKINWWGQLIRADQGLVGMDPFQWMAWKLSPILWVRDPLEYIINHILNFISDILNFTVGLTPIWVEIWGASHLMEGHSQTPRIRIFNRWGRPIVKHHFLLSSLMGAWMIHPDLHKYHLHFVRALLFHPLKLASQHVRLIFWI